jgi:hypothetical protein
VEGWDFSWFEGRATEQRPSWGYAEGLAARLASSGTSLDIQTGGGEVYAWALARVGSSRSARRGVTVVTESWPPNLALAAGRLADHGGSVVHQADQAGLPFRAGAFDLVSSRHPTVVVWSELARVLALGGTYFSQQVGAGTNRELSDFLMGPQPVSDRRRPDRAVAAAEAAGLEVIDLRSESLEVRFFDIGAVVYFLRKVLWTVPGFSVERYRQRLLSLHQLIERDGHFLSHSERFLIEARSPR